MLDVEKKAFFSEMCIRATEVRRMEIRPKGNAQFIFLCKPQKSLVNVCLMKKLKSTAKKVFVCFYNFGEENF